MESKKDQPKNRELFYQIYLPLLIFVLLILAVGILSITETTSNFAATAHWANISLILLSIPFMVLTFLVLAILCLIVFGQYKLIRWLPIKLKKLYALLLMASAYIWKYSDKVVKPFIELNTWSSTIKGFRKEK